MKLNKLATLLLTTILFSSFAQSTLQAQAGSSGQTAFQSAEEALRALTSAAKAEDSKRMIELFGKNSKEIFLTGDTISDIAFLRKLSRRFEERAELFSVNSLDHPNEQWYLVRFGIEGWNMRVPLVNTKKGWSFATEYTTESNRKIRISLNEVATVDTLRALVKAQRTYQAKDWNQDGVLEYAQKFISSPNTKDGLYWPDLPGQATSPIDGLVARAMLDGYKTSKDNHPTYSGYVYKILTEQGAKTRGGKKSYLQDKSLVNGFAILAYPVEWRSSGNSCFVVGTDAQVWQKDFGSRTSTIAKKITSMDLDSLWLRVDPNLGGENSRSNW